jgi:hypothetical protein
MTKQTKEKGFETASSVVMGFILAVFLMVPATPAIMALACRIELAFSLFSES